MPKSIHLPPKNGECKRLLKKREIKQGLSGILKKILSRFLKGDKFLNALHQKYVHSA